MIWGLVKLFINRLESIVIIFVFKECIHCFLVVVVRDDLSLGARLERKYGQKDHEEKQSGFHYGDRFGY